jgi:hypothetical protein
MDECPCGWLDDGVHVCAHEVHQLRQLPQGNVLAFPEYVAHDYTISLLQYRLCLQLNLVFTLFKSLSCEIELGSRQCGWTKHY